MIIKKWLQTMIEKWQPWIFIAILSVLGLLILFQFQSFGQNWNGGISDQMPAQPTTPTPSTAPTPPATPAPLSAPAEAKPKITVPKHPPVKIFASVDRLKFVGEQNIVLKTDIVFYRHINPFWEELSKIDFSPFKLEKFDLSERKMFDREKDLSRDFREATFLLTLPVSSKCGSYTIPSFILGYSYFQGKDEIKGKAKSKALKVEKVPILVTATLEKDVLTIGEINTAHLTIWREKYIRILNYELETAKDTTDVTKEDFRRWLKSLEVRSQKITDLDKPEFKSFKILSKKTETETQKLVIKERFEYRFAFYELGGKEFPIPRFHIWYLDKSQEEKFQKPKEIVTSPLAIQINSVVGEKRKSLEWLKPPEPNQKNNLYYFGYAPLAVGGICFLIFAGSAVLSLLRLRHKAAIAIDIFEPPPKIWHSLSNLERATVINRQLIIQIRNEFAEMLGSILGIANGPSKAKTSSKIAFEFARKGFSENLTREIENCFHLLDNAIQDYEDKDWAEIWTRIKGITASPEISKFLKKRKRFLVF